MKVTYKSRKITKGCAVDHGHGTLMLSAAERFDVFDLVV